MTTPAVLKSLEKHSARVARRSRSFGEFSLHVDQCRKCRDLHHMHDYGREWLRVYFLTNGEMVGASTTTLSVNHEQI